MLVLFETSAGYGLFQINDEGSLQKQDDLSKLFSSPQEAQKRLTLRAFHKFDNTTEALSAATALVEGKMSKELKTFLKGTIVKKKLNDTLLVAESKLGGEIKDKLGIQCLHNSMVDELMRCLRQHRDSLLTGIDEGDMNSMVLGLAHSLSRYKIKFSPDKVDVMIVQAISLLDDLDKELNTYAMRVKEWYGWHFPEMVKIISDNILYAKLVQLMGMRSKAAETRFSSLLPEELEATLKDAAQLSMGTEISEEDLLNIRSLCNQVIEIHEYREQLYEYLRNRMQAIAPNLSIMVGELVGARLIAHAGSLLSLAKYPASTVQILGAEKALFRALKTKHETPKYGLIYHASLVGQATPKNKGKVSRMVAAKTALATRVDALAEQVSTDVGITGRAKIEARMHALEGTQAHSLATKTPKKIEKYDPSRLPSGEQRATATYNPAADVTPKSDGKRKRVDEKQETNGDANDKKKKEKKAKKAKKAAAAAEEEEEKPAKKGKKATGKKAEKRKREEEAAPKTPEKKDKKQKKDKKKKRKVAA